MTGHIHADSMKLYADDAARNEKPWELWEYNPYNSKWSSLDKNPMWCENYKYRRKPRTININGFEVPEPMREKPEIGSTYYYISLSVDGLARYSLWDDVEWDIILFNMGICHTTEEAAEIHAKALLSFTRKDGE